MLGSNGGPGAVWVVGLVVGVLTMVAEGIAGMTLAERAWGVAVGRTLECVGGRVLEGGNMCVLWWPWLPVCHLTTGRYQGPNPHSYHLRVGTPQRHTCVIRAHTPKLPAQI